VANLKPYHFTQNDDDKITASLELDGNSTQKTPLRGASPSGSQNPLIPKEKFLHLGYVQITRPSSQFPTFRLRFTPAFGWVYGPINLNERSDGYGFPPERLFLNPESTWCRYIQKGNDARTVPSGEYAVSTTPDNVTDRSSQTYWDSFGKGQFIQLKLIALSNIVSVSIAWFKGDKRKYNFLISVSEDGETFSEVFRGISGGETVLAEKYVVSNTTAQYIRITVNGNTENDWASISQILVNGDESSESIGVEQATSSSVDSGISLGLVDDVCDGIIQCSLGEDLYAFARVAVGPPKYSPDRRHFVSLADGLTDRVRRLDIRDPSYMEDRDLTSLEIRDFFERVLETVDLTNIDAQNDRVYQTNIGIPQDLGLNNQEADSMAKSKVFPIFPPQELVTGHKFPLTELGRQNHRRFVSLEVLEDMFRERPDLLENYIRKPLTDDKFYDRKMPFAMRGSDGQPLHITNRQYDLLVFWQRLLKKGAEEET